jgi:NADH dehydrogenase
VDAAQSEFPQKSEGLRAVQSVFVTGCSGFVGRRLLPRLTASGVKEIVCLSRSGELPHGVAAGDASLRCVRGNLTEPASYAPDLAKCECVVHLAAATGKATREEHFRTNLEGTRALLEAAKQAGVKKFLFVSSIAAKFPDKTNYWYAQAKAQAEELVRQSGLAHTILRPTMIFGPAAPVLEGMAKLALLPVTPMFGNGRTPVQPIHVDDVAGCISDILERDAFHGETIEIGGPEKLSIEKMLARIRESRGGGAMRAVHMPLGIVVPILRMLEPVAYKFLPFTLGQLATFRNDGTIRENPLWLENKNSLEPISTMLASAAPVVTAREQDAVPDRAALEAECRVLAAYLTDAPPNAFVTQKYAQAHRVTQHYFSFGQFDDLLLRFALAGRPFLAIADAYASLAARRSLLRRKLILLAAILESCPPERGLREDVDSRNQFSLWLSLLGRGLLFLLKLLAGLFVLLPLQILKGGLRAPSPAGGGGH